LRVLWLASKLPTAPTDVEAPPELPTTIQTFD
jgi:hypothetical protein